VIQEIIHTWAYRCSGSGIEKVNLPVIAEYEFTFLLNGREFLTIGCHGCDLEEIAAGHLVSEGIIASRNDIKGIAVDEERKTVNVKSSAGIDAGDGNMPAVETGNPPENERAAARALPSIDAEVVVSSAEEFYSLSRKNSETHAVHCAALYGISGKRLSFYEEIGRHHAIGKVLGSAFMNGLSLDRTMLLSTGRVTGEIVKKLALTDIPVIITRKAPTCLGIERARLYNIMLITGVSRDEFYVHHGIEHLRAPDQWTRAKGKNL
jgi:FdhD protein